MMGRSGVALSAEIRVDGKLSISEIGLGILQRLIVVMQK
jgi:hypothetical protein